MNTGRTHFKKGQAPWNKGIKTGPNPEHSARMKGRPSWNKGLKGYKAGEEHWSFGKERNEIRDEKHWNWKGEDGIYSTHHQWVKRRLGKPSLCEHCGTTEAKRFEWANKSGQYKRDLSDWMRLCTSCHHKYDRISERGWATRRLQHG